MDYLYENNGTYKTLTLGNLSGTGGQFNMNVDIASVDENDPGHGAGTSGDLLVVKGAVGGNHQVAVTNRGDLATTGREVLTIIQTPDTNAQDYFRLTNKVELGGYIYDLKAVEDAGNKHLALMAVDKVFDPPITPGGQTSVNVHAGNYMIHNAELQTLMKRMGDLRNEKVRQGNAWGRVYGGELTSKSDGRLSAFDMKYYGIQVGADKQIARKDGRGTSYVGGFFGYTDGGLDFRFGGGDTESISFGTYWAYKHHNDFYSDLVLKYGRMESDYNVLDTAGHKVEGKDIKSDVFSLSLEIGRRYHFDQKEKQGLYLEPQAQVTISHFSGDDFTASNGLNTKVDPFRSIIARVGTHVGYEKKGPENTFNVYAKGYFMKEFDGKMDFKLNGSPEKTSYEDTWFVYGIGATAKLGTRHNLYLDFEKWTGGRMEQDWALNGGYRYSW